MVPGLPGMDRARPRGGEKRSAARLGDRLGAVVAALVRGHAWLVERTSLYTRTVLGITAAICLALLIFGVGEAWLDYRLHAQVQQVQAQNDRLRQDTAATLRQAEWAESPGAIEDAARAMGYARPGEQPVVIVTTTPTTTPLPAPAPPARQTAGQTSQQQRTSGLVSPLQILFGG